MEQINDTTYGFRMPTGDIVEIGRKDNLTEFEPHLVLPRWGGECSVTPSIELTGNMSLPRVTDKQVEVETNRSIIRWYPIDPTPQWELGAFRMEITHLKKPLSNRIASKIIGHNVVACYQAPLTQEEIAEGCTRPDNIEGSYAFYHATRQPIHASQAIAEKYRACKVGHKPRPRIIDDKGDWCWGELSIDLKTGIQIITIPIEFYNSAKYPIRHDAGADTFGYTTVGGTDTLARRPGGGVYTGAAGTADSITAAIRHASGSGSLNQKSCLYNAGTDVLIDTTTPASVGYTTSYAWKTTSFASPPTISAISYAILQVLDSNDISLYLAADHGAGARWFDTWTAYAAAFTNPYAGNKYATFENVSIYCTYTPSGGPTIYELSVTDGFKVGDSPSESMVAGVAVLDGFKAGDSPTELAEISAILTDGFKLGEAILSSMTANPTLTDGIKLSDTPLSEMIAGLSITDGITLSDIAELTALMGVEVADGVKLGDVPAITLAGIIYYLSVSDGIKLGDTPLKEMIAQLNVSDGIKFSDAAWTRFLRVLRHYIDLHDKSKTIDTHDQRSYLEQHDKTKTIDTNEQRGYVDLHDESMTVEE